LNVRAQTQRHQFLVERDLGVPRGISQYAARTEDFRRPNMRHCDKRLAAIDQNR
jgi:hypothetical protein